MRLYYSDHGVELWHGDCRQAREVTGSRLFSLVLADPPYEQTSLAWDRWPHGWLDVARDFRADDGSLWCWGTLRLFMNRAQDFAAAGWRLAQDTIWEKHNGSQPATDRFHRVHEQAAHVYPVATPWESIYKDPQKVPAPPQHRHKAGRVVHRKAQPAHTGKHKPSTYVDDGTRRQRSVWHVRSEHYQGKGVATPKPLGCWNPSSGTRARPGAGCLCPSLAEARNWRPRAGVDVPPWASTWTRRPWSRQRAD